MKLTASIAAAAAILGASLAQTALAITPEQARQDFEQKQLDKGYTQAQINQFLASASKSEAVLEAIARPWEAKPWHQYYPIFLTDKRVKGGVDFWQEHSDTISKVSNKFGVEPEIIVAIIGVETYYGTYMGTHKVIDALYSLGFHYPPRATFFRSELGHLMDLVEEHALPLDELKGSYAGAMGYGQFIPSSYRAYAVDFDKDGRIDLLNNPKDAIASVANYFKRHGWRADEPVILPIEVDEQLDAKAHIWDKKKPKHSVAEWMAKGAKPSIGQDMDINQKAILVELEQEQGADYYLGLNNFYAITRYNHSPLYAMAVYRLSQQIKEAHANR
ncbi:lytic murein transglycosylase B [Paraferrimonas sedimenticola]|uniref:Lytic murein transglycosylase B n=1 Tax=Paraferrimonas sedimenticola TaxID=375674 RepID=A0AA37S055_9GAMM|nr:lytic murein transglycosylase B [Paraferrimonas sedimenticola]GLP98017.1 lytic murein transglycosylase B [Paraferrimonas sedimenticola]